jgi:uncharacterized membrane protein YhaH (DUF805 family)
MKKYFSLSGRMRRQDFCLFWLAGLILRLGVGYLAQHTELSPTLLGIAVIALFTPPIVRRLHDLGYSGWLSIGVIAIPYVSIFLLLFAGEKGSNVYGPDPTQKVVEPGAAPNGGPATQLGNSGVTEGPPSVS